MASLSVEWTDTARFDLEEIFDFAVLSSTEFAFRLINSIVSREEQLKTHPHSGKIEPEISNDNVIYRSLIEGNFKIVYRALDSKVFVHRVFDVRQNPNRMKIK